MFEDSLFESGEVMRTNRGATTALSIVLQTALLGIAVIAPLIYTEALPLAQMPLVVTVPMPPRESPPAGRAQEVRPRASVVRTEMLGQHILIPSTIPAHAQPIHDVAAPLDGILRGCDPSVQDCSGSPVTGIRIPEGIFNSRPVVLPHFQGPSRVVISRGVTLGHLILRVEPVYPEMALRTRVQGEVLLHAVIGRDGTIQNLTFVSGHPLLAQAAMDAVRRWRYQPFLLNGQPVEVDTEVTLHFHLAN